VRLFTAVYPSEEALRHLDLALGGVGGPSVVDPGVGLRWLPREQRHLTLAFHGEVPDGAVPGYVRALSSALTEVAPFDVALAGSGSFGGRTLWVGVGDGIDGLRRLGAAVDDAASSSDVPTNDRAGGRPHLTVARASLARLPNRNGNRRPRGRAGDDGSPLVPWARALMVYRGPAWHVDAVHVVASELGKGRSGGPLHHDLAVLPLAAA
jgi:2'-5' RNA ligase